MDWEVQARTAEGWMTLHAFFTRYAAYEVMNQELRQYPDLELRVVQIL